MTPFTTEINGAVLALLVAYHDQFDKDHSLQYTMEEALIAGLKASRRSKEYSIQTQNLKKFNEAIAKDPSVVTDPIRMQVLCRKFGIGATKVQMNEFTSQDEAALVEELTEAATKPVAEGAAA